MLKIQHYLRSGNTIEDLKSQYGLHVTTHKTYPNLHLFKYDMIESPMGDPIVQESRGLILDSENNWDIVACPFFKFFNYGEGNAATIDWNTAKILEKVDGSIITIYPYRDEWQVSSSGSPDAAGELSGWSLTCTYSTDDGVEFPIPKNFREYFLQALTYKLSKINHPTVIKRIDFNKNGLMYYDNYCEHTSDYCFMFELTGPLNRIVVRHGNLDITLLGGRNLKTLQELTIDEADKLLSCSSLWAETHSKPKEFPLNNITNILKSFESFRGLDQEGYVVCDGNFNRIKVKHPQYLALHHLKSGLSPKSFIEIVRMGETSEVLSAFPEYKTTIKSIENKITELVIDLEAEYERIKHLPTQKEFALRAVHHRMSGALFAIRAKKIQNFREYIRTMHIDKLADLLRNGKEEPRFQGSIM